MEISCILHVKWTPTSQSCKRLRAKISHQEMDPVTGEEDPMHLYKVFQKSFDKISTPDVGLHYQEYNPQLLHPEAHVYVDISQIQSNSLGHTAALDTASATLFPPTCQQSYLPPNFNNSTRVSTESDMFMFDDVLSIIKSHAETGHNKRKAKEMSVASSCFPTSHSLDLVASSSAGGIGRAKGKTSKENEELEKRKDRRFANNVRERIRIRSINDTLNELGRICTKINPSNTDKPQTKLGVLNMAIESIDYLESQVRELV